MKLSVRDQKNNYLVYIKNKLIQDIPMYLEEYKYEKIFLITDTNVSNIYLSALLNRLEDFRVSHYIVTPGESSKSLHTVNTIYEKLIENNIDRKSVIISLGGGVVGDLSGFIASTYMRGIDFIQIPTTLLSQVDSSVGGKVGINFNNIKNIIGSFYQPKKVLIDPSTLETLDERHIKSGLAEIIKYGIIKDYSFLLWISKEMIDIKNLNLEKISKVIKKSLDIKEKIVYLDTYENNIRKILNFGHTIGHGVESLDNFSKFTHGEAVAIGMLSECYIAKELGYISNEYYEEIKKIISKISPKVQFTDEEKKQILLSIKNDKKNINDKIVFILPTGPGSVNIVEKGIENKLIIESLEMEG